MGPIWDAELRVWDAKNFGLVSPGTHRNKFVKKSLKDLHFLDKINNNYISYGTADKDLLLPVYRKVGKGGVALLWNRKFHKYITTLDINSDRIIGIQFKYSQNCYIYLLQVYMPSRIML